MSATVAAVPDRDDLEAAIVETFEGILGHRQATVFASIVVRYPGTRGDSLPDVIDHDLNRGPEQIRADIDDLLERGLLPTDDDGAIVEPIKSGDEFLAHVDGWLEERDHDDERERFSTLTDDVLTRYEYFLNQRVDVRAQVIPLAASEDGSATYKKDLRNSIQGDVSEVNIAAFSLESQKELIEDVVVSGIESGIDFRFLLYHPELGSELERPRVKEPIRKGIEFLNTLQEETRQAEGEISYRLVKDREQSYFRGLVYRSENPDECTYRVFIHDPTKERGLSSIVLRGEEKTTMYQILESYFDQAWENAIEPGAMGYVKRNWKYALLAVPLLGVYLWVIGAISQLSFVLIQAIGIPIASELVRDLVLGFAD